MSTIEFATGETTPTSRGPFFDLWALLDGDFGEEWIVPYLRLREVSRLECVSRAMQKTIIAGRGWSQSAMWELQPKAFVPLPSARNDEAQSACKQALRHIVTSLRHATFSPEAIPVVCASFGQGQSLARAVLRAQQRAEQHLQQGGCWAEVRIQRFHFPSATTTSPVTPEKPKALWHVSKPVEVALQAERACKVKLAWQAGSILVACENEEGQQDEPAELARPSSPSGSVVNESCGVLDVQTVSEAVILRLLDVQISPKSSSWTKGSGLFSTCASQEKLAEELRSGLLCVTCFRDVSPSTLHRQLQKQSEMRMHTMNLDAPTRRRAREV